MIVRTCKRRGITCSICGQAPSVYPEITEKLVSWGATSVSVSPDMIDKTRLVVWEVESKLKEHKVTASDKRRAQTLTLFQRIFKKD
jgi:phosphoenolpyruvate-protein kinase (PTS system EI component)